MATSRYVFHEKSSKNNGARLPIDTIRIFSPYVDVVAFSIFSQSYQEKHNNIDTTLKQLFAQIYTQNEKYIHTHALSACDLHTYTHTRPRIHSHMRKRRAHLNKRNIAQWTNDIWTQEIHFPTHISHRLIHTNTMTHTQIK